jgi:type I restriction enzyme S subunit
MMYEWKEYSLTDLYEVRSGLSKPASAFGTGYPFLSFKEVFNNYFLPNNLELLVESSEKERVGCSIKRGDIFLTRTSETMHELGMSSVSLKDYKNATFNGFSKRLRPKSISHDLVWPEFIGYALRSPSFRVKMLGFSTMSTRASLNNEMIGRLKVKLPPINIQKNIASILSSLDEKISNNTAMNATLEKIAQRIFKSWFVDFDPVKANAEGVPFDGLSPEIQALFPNEFEESELGMIPKGWELVSASNSLKVYGGYAFKSKEFTETGTPVIKIKNITSSRTVDIAGSNCVASFDNKKLKKFILYDGDILMAMTGATVGKSGIFANLDKPALLNQRVAKITGHEDKTCWFAYLNAISDSFFDTVVQQAYGSAQPNISANDIGNIKIITPSREIKEKFNLLMSPIFERWITNKNQEQLLTKIRDKLLPRLISGKITIQKAEELLEEAS